MQQGGPGEGIAYHWKRKKGRRGKSRKEGGGRGVREGITTTQERERPKGTQPAEGSLQTTCSQSEQIWLAGTDRKCLLFNFYLNIKAHTSISWNPL